MIMGPGLHLAQATMMNTPYYLVKITLCAVSALFVLSLISQARGG